MRPAGNRKIRPPKEVKGPWSGRQESSFWTCGLGLDQCLLQSLLLNKGRGELDEIVLIFRESMRFPLLSL